MSGHYYYHMYICWHHIATCYSGQWSIYHSRVNVLVPGCLATINYHSLVSLVQWHHTATCYSGLWSTSQLREWLEKVLVPDVWANAGQINLSLTSLIWSDHNYNLWWCIYSLLAVWSFLKSQPFDSTTTSSWVSKKNIHWYRRLHASVMKEQVWTFSQRKYT